jgi:hypothetical protein
LYILTLEVFVLCLLPPFWWIQSNSVMIFNLTQR